MQELDRYARWLLVKVVYRAVLDVAGPAGRLAEGAATPSAAWFRADALRWFEEDGVECAVALGFPRAGVEGWLRAHCVSALAETGGSSRGAVSAVGGRGRV